jgi:LysM repeat protein
MRWLVVMVVFVASDASGFVHVVRPKESLADIAKRMYGDAAHEGLLAGANALDVQGGSAIVPGMHLQVPACDYHQVTEHETWASIARDYLGDDKRADHLARVNDALAWVAPSSGQEVRIPYVLTYIAAEGDTTTGIARKYLGDPNKAWELDAYNDKKEWKLLRGDVVLVPISDLELTDVGRAEARGEGRAHHEAGGTVMAQQRKFSVEVPALLADVRAGRYIDAVARGNRLLGHTDLTHAQLAAIERALIEAYVALDSVGPAALACDEWRKLEPGVTLDPTYVSPKIREACHAKP